MPPKKNAPKLITRLYGYARLIGHTVSREDDLKTLPKRHGGYTRPGSNK